MKLISPETSRASHGKNADTTRYQKCRYRRYRWYRRYIAIISTYWPISNLFLNPDDSVCSLHCNEYTTLADLRTSAVWAIYQFPVNLAVFLRLNLMNNSYVSRSEVTSLSRLLCCSPAGVAFASFSVWLSVCRRSKLSRTAAARPQRETACGYSSRSQNIWFD